MKLKGRIKEVRLHDGQANLRTPVLDVWLDLGGFDARMPLPVAREELSAYHIGAEVEVTVEHTAVQRSAPGTAAMQPSARTDRRSLANPDSPLREG